MKPWLKITFDATLPGFASVSQFPKKRRAMTPGQWVVFDKDKGVGGLKEYHRGALLFQSGDIEDCHAYINRERRA